MRKIESKKDIENRKRKNATYLGLTLVILLVFSTAGYSIINTNNEKDNGSGKHSYQGIEFVRNGEIWASNIGGTNFYFMNLPENVSAVSVEGNFSFEDYLGGPLYVVNLVEESQLILGNLEPFVSRMQEACVEDRNCGDETLPMKDCTSNVLIFTEAGEEKVLKEENCVYISSNFESADAFMYKILGLR